MLDLLRYAGMVGCLAVIVVALIDGQRRTRRLMLPIVDPHPRDVLPPEFVQAVDDACTPPPAGQVDRVITELRSQPGDS